MKLVADPQHPVHRAGDSGGHRGDRALSGGKLRRHGGGVVRDEHRHAGLPGPDPREKLLPPCVFRGHLYQVLDVDGGQDGVARAICRAVLGLDPHAPASLDQQPHHRFARQHHPAMCLDAAGQRLRQGGGSAFGHGPAVRLAPVRDGICQPAGPGPVGRLHGHERHPQHERPGMPVLERVPDDLPSALRLAADPPRPLRMAFDQLQQRWTEPDRRVPVGAEDPLHGIVLGHHLPEGRRVAW